jgi:aspartate-semialdehyde dehydrogenase
VKAAVLGATGLVGQRFVAMLNDHPWFELAALTGSERTEGQEFGKAVRWKMETPLKSEVAEMPLQPTEPRSLKDVDVLFSALPADIARSAEEELARAGFVILSNASAHRMDPDVPLVNPEVNCGDVRLVEDQRRRRKWDGAIVTNPNCTTAILTLPLKPILDKFPVNRILVSTMQAASGAGYPGVASLDIIDNVIPFIDQEEEKVERETRKILGRSELKVGASCNRVAVLDGHTENVFVEFERDVSAEEVTECMRVFQGEPQTLDLPNAPVPPLVVRSESDRPQPRFDRMAGNGMAVVVGRVRADRALGGVKFVALGHNTIRGAAGCSILIAEYMKAKNYL